MRMMTTFSVDGLLQTTTMHALPWTSILDVRFKGYVAWPFQSTIGHYQPIGKWDCRMTLIALQFLNFMLPPFQRYPKDAFIATPTSLQIFALKWSQKIVLNCAAVFKFWAAPLAEISSRMPLMPTPNSNFCSRMVTKHCGNFLLNYATIFNFVLFTFLQNTGRRLELIFHINGNRRLDWYMLAT